MGQDSRVLRLASVSMSIRSCVYTSDWELKSLKGAKRLKIFLLASQGLDHGDVIGEVVDSFDPFYICVR